MSATEELLQGLITILAAFGIIVGFICAVWIFHDAISKIKRK